MKPSLPLRLPKPQVVNYQAKKIWLVCILFFCVSHAFSQDIIYTAKGDQIKCKVETIGEDSISYHAIGAAINSPVISLIRHDIYVIKYGNSGLTDTITPKNVKVSPKMAANSTPVTKTPTGLADATIFTTDGKQIVGKVVEIDETDAVSYLLAGNAAVQKINIKSVMKVTDSTGDIYNMPGTKPTKQAAKGDKKAGDDTAHKDTIFAILQNWSRKYIAPPLEIF